MIDSYQFPRRWADYLKIEKDVASLLTKDKKEKLKNELLTMRDSLKTREENRTHEENQQEAVGELSMYDNHPADMGTELFEREKDMALNIHAESKLNKVNAALDRLDKGTYGICEMCGKPIQFERLEIVPYTTLCIEDAIIQEANTVNEVTSSNDSNTFEETMDGRAMDYENSFDEVAEFGTSDSPQDFRDSEHPTYSDDDADEVKGIDKVVGQSLTDDTND